VLDADGIVYWSREVLERLQGTCQPAGLLTFCIDDGGGTCAFWCSSGVFTHHHQRGLLARYDDVPAFFHPKSTNMSFVDGHVENRTWSDSRTLTAKNQLQQLNNSDLIALKRAIFGPFD
jgi:prepilin-type processing-associated H-X9-DG protein